MRIHVICACNCFTPLYTHLIYPPYIFKIYIYILDIIKLLTIKTEFSIIRI